MAARRHRPDPKAPEILDAIATGDRRSSRVRHGRGRRHQQHAGDRSTRSRDSPLAAVVFYELIRFQTADAAAFVERGLPPDRGARPATDASASAWPRMRRTRWRRSCSARSGERSTAIRSRRAACICPSRRKRSSSFRRRAARGASSSKNWASGIRPGSRRASARCSIWTTAASSTRACWRSTACR